MIDPILVEILARYWNNDGNAQVSRWLTALYLAVVSR